MPKELDIDIYDFAAYIAKLCAVKNYFVNLTKLQKLMYCVYGAVLWTVPNRQNSHKRLQLDTFL